MLDENGFPKKIVFENTSHSIFYEKNKNILCTMARTNFVGLSGVFKEHIIRMSGYGSNELMNLNRICWAIGTVSGSVSLSEEKVFLVKVLKNLLNMVDSYKKIQEKSTVATNIMYIVG